MHLRVKGTEGAPLALFLHPFPLSGACWDGLLQACADAGLRAAALDAPGFGEAQALGLPLEMEALARLARDTLDQLAVQQAAIVGCSMGGYAALAFARLFPERLRALALVCTKASADSSEAKEKRERNALLALSQGPAAVVEAMLPSLLAPGSLALPAARALAAQATAQGLADALRGMALRPDASASLAQIHAAALIVAGEFDQVIPRAETDALTRGIPSAKQALIAGAGHLCFLEQPALVAAALIPHLR